MVIGISTLLNPRVVIADEPTSALDVTTQKAVIRLLFDLMDQGIIGSMLFITHELPLLRHVSNRIAVMYAGEFVELGTTEQVIFDSRQPYTKALMGSMLSAEPGQKSKKPIAIEGAPLAVVGKPTRCSRLPLADRIHFLEALESHESGLFAMLAVAFKVPLCVPMFEQEDGLAETGFDRPTLSQRRSLEVVQEASR